MTFLVQFSLVIGSVLRNFHKQTLNCPSYYMPELGHMVKKKKVYFYMIYNVIVHNSI